MKDSVVRGQLLQFLYRHRDEGAIAFGRGKEAIFPPQGISRRDWHGAVAQLAEYGLIDWKPTEDRSGRGLLEGFASISEFGIKVIETGCESPIRIAFDRTTSAHTQPQVASAGAAEQASLTRAMEKVIAAIEQAEVSEQEKKEARSLLRKLLTGRAAAKVLGTGARSLRTKYLAK